MKWLLIAVTMYGSDGIFNDTRELELYTKTFSTETDCIKKMYEIKNKTTFTKVLKDASCVNI